ncbi:probable 18S rRNA (guanine-N(7))-methyltransferase [Acanthaster planci]|uniref:18S rRNA (guanine-N(7))-methyltransferase n=1 Tax=Acanthaster planci TaxID=133434 RepID=A0A8B7YJD9_ACAPL|nr:probable 18S rRNA (guanine-N(7))-methyltransferase [Acanthaster planci]
MAFRLIVSCKSVTSLAPVRKSWTSLEVSLSEFKKWKLKLVRSQHQQLRSRNLYFRSSARETSLCLSAVAINSRVIHTTMASCRRPEHKAPPEMFYNEEEARKYTSNSRMIEIQMTMSERAVELLNLPEDTPSYVLDVGCGSGLSGETLTEQGHYWMGLDISTNMLDIALEREVEGDLFVSDMGQGVFFKPGTFDGVISISALQWLCNADKKSHHPPKRLYRFFCTLYSAMRRGSRAVFQFYPENSQQLELITSQAMKAGFTGGVVVDYPNSTRAKKMFLCLFAGLANPQIPKGLGTGKGDRGIPTEVKYSDSRQRIKQMKGKPPKKSREWIKEKKERRRRQGKGDVKPDSKYTGRRRPGKF